MPVTRALSPAAIAACARAAQEQGVIVTVEAGGRVYRFAPTGQSLPLTASEEDKAACDEAFGLCD